MGDLRLYLLGSPRLELDGEAIEFETRKNAALVAYLAVTGESHSRESLVTLLWPELDPSRARAGLRRNLSTLKKALGERWLVVERATVGTDPAAGLWLDVTEFRRLLSVRQAHGHPENDACPECLAALAEAAELYRGDFLAGFTLRDSANFDEWQFFQTEGLRGEMAAALEQLVRAHAGRDEVEQAIPYARRWLALDPLHEPAHRRLMQLYARSGQRAAALRQYQECVRLLEEELGVEPEQETTDLHEQIRTGQPIDGQPPSKPRHNLPAQTTPFIGRDDELAEIETRLSEPGCRLLTLLGPGGAGKTRLALEVAERLVTGDRADCFEHGVYFVPLAPLRSADGIVPAVADAIGFRFLAAGAEPRQQLLDYLRQKRTLLVLDNFEHLLESADLVTHVLETAPEVRILATSRARLNVQGEHLFPVAGMRFPDWETPEDAAGYDAVRLFVQGARRVRPTFELEKDDPAYVTRICRLVGGMPLGILLAAAWVEMLTPREIAAEIERSLDFLATEMRDVPERQRSIRAVFDHSWELLTDRERAVMQALSVFRGGCTREAAEAVAGASLRELKGLVDRSLLHRASATLPGMEGRYGMHELLRQYAAGKLDQDPAAAEEARDRHCACYAAALQRWDVDLKGPRQQAAIAEIEVDGENARSAWRRAVERGQIDRMAQATDGLCRFYLWRGRYQEGEASCQLASAGLSAAAPGDEVRLLAKVLAWQGMFSFHRERGGLAKDLIRESLALLEGPALAGQDVRAEKAVALLHLGYIVLNSDVEKARGLFEQSLALYRALGDRWGTANALNPLGHVASGPSAWGDANRLYEESLAIRRELDDRKGIADSLVGLCNVARSQGRLVEAEGMGREAVGIAREIGDQNGLTNALLGQGASLILLGKPTEACAAFEECAAINDDLARPNLVAISRIQSCFVRLLMGQYEQARTIAQACLEQARAGDHLQAIWYALQTLGRIVMAKEAYAEALDLLQESSDAFPHPSDTPITLLTDRGIASIWLGRLAEAEEHLRQGLRRAVELGIHSVSLYVLLAVALLLSARGEQERAVELYALASRSPAVASYRWFEDVAGRRVAAAAAVLPEDVAAAARERGRARDLQATIAELAAEMDTGRSTA